MMASQEHSSTAVTNVCELLEQGLDPALRDASGRTMVHFAALRGDITALGFLMERGADFSLTDRKGNTPLHLCLQPLVIQFLVRKAGISPSTRNFQGDTALVLAERLGAKKGILCLLKLLEEEELAGKLHLQKRNNETKALKKPTNILMETWSEFVNDLGIKRLFYLLLVLGLVSFFLTYYLLVEDYKPTPINVSE